jgi:predicted ABC-type ATPase
MTPEPPTIYLFAGCNGAGKTTFARAYLTAGFDTPPRFLNAEEIARGLSPLAPESVALKAGKLLLSEIDGCLRTNQSFAIESTLSGHAQVGILARARLLSYRIEMFYLWIPSSSVAIKRIAQWVRKGGHPIPNKDVERRYSRSLENFVHLYAPIADIWKVWDNTQRPPKLTLSSAHANFPQLEKLLLP